MKKNAVKIECTREQIQALLDAIDVAIERSKDDLRFLRDPKNAGLLNNPKQAIAYHELMLSEFDILTEIVKKAIYGERQKAAKDV